jgi:predicted nuclease of predicted toxin-antitoxin system
MRIKLDENVPVSLVTVLKTLGHDVDSVPQEGLTGKPDPDVWRAAQECGRFLITQDLDFSDVRRYAPGTLQGLLLVRLKQTGRRAVYRGVTSLFTDYDPNLWRECFVLATEVKVRVHRPRSDTDA